MQGGHIIRPAETQAIARQGSTDAISSLAGEVLQQRQIVAGCRAQGDTNGMFGRLFQRRCKRYARLTIKRTKWQHLKQTHPAGRQRAGFIKNKMCGPRQRLDGMTARHQQTGTRHCPARHAERHRRRQRQGTGARDNKDRHGNPQRL